MSLRAPRGRRNEAKLSKNSQLYHRKYATISRRKYAYAQVCIHACLHSIYRQKGIQGLVPSCDKAPKGLSNDNIAVIAPYDAFLYLVYVASFLSFVYVISTDKA